MIARRRGQQVTFLNAETYTTSMPILLAFTLIAACLPVDLAGAAVRSCSTSRAVANRRRDSVCFKRRVHPPNVGGTHTSP